MAIEMAAGDMTRELLVMVGGVVVDVAKQDEAIVGMRGDGAPGGATL
jgi:hypothetical protein